MTFETWYAALHQGFAYTERKGVGFYQIPAFLDTGLVQHAFTTRKGGISQGCYASMNLSWERTTDSMETETNYRIACEALGVPADALIIVNCQHTNRVKVVSHAQAGDGFTRKYRADEEGFDGLITDDPSVVLCTVHGDCTPLFFLDVKRRVAALCHAGWKGLVNRIVKHVLDAMQEQFGTRPEDVLAAVGPCIQACCFEVHEDVAKPYREAFPEANGVLSGPKPDKYRVDLQRGAAYELFTWGIPAKQVTVSNLCTCCQCERFHSYRRDGKQGGSMASIMQLVVKA